MHDQIYREQVNWSALVGGPESRSPEKAMSRYAKQLGLDVDAFDRCLETHQFQPQILANLRQGERLGVTGTPTLIVGARKLPAGAPTYDQLKAFVDSATAEVRRREGTTSK
jgi:protein-disulfide isomerase